jgi:uncharacterized protein (DUF1499 family)
MRRIWWGPSGVVVVLTVSGPALAHGEWVAPELGFRLYFFGAILAALSAMGCAAAAAVASALGRSWRASALRAAILPLLLTLAVMASTMGITQWPYNDVTTDFADPPAFIHGALVGEAYPADFRSAQQEAFPDLQPTVLRVPPGEALRRVGETARGMPNWTKIQVSEADGAVQAVAVSRVFRFRDDVVVRVRPADGGSRIDLRSRSRVGRSDLGANAERIESFLEALAGS